MDISTISNIVLAILSFILAFLSIFFVVITLRQNKKILEEASRPYISIFMDSIMIHNRQNYFVIKNFGNSNAIIKKFIYPDELKTSTQKNKDLNKQFERIENMVIAPGQSVLLPYGIPDYSSRIYEFEITYSANFSKKVYIEKITVRPNGLVSRPNKSEYDNFESDLINAINEIVEKLI